MKLVNLINAFLMIKTLNLKIDYQFEPGKVMGRIQSSKVE